jgi:transcriptional regulator with XRE-family HTH domain
MTPAIWIKKLRQNKDVKQVTVAERMGISQQAYSKLENANWVTKGRLPLILEALDSNPEELNKIAQLLHWNQKKQRLTLGEQEMPYRRKD